MPSQETSGTQALVVTDIVDSTNAAPINIQATGHGLITADEAIIIEHDHPESLGRHTVIRVDDDNATLNGTTGSTVGTALGQIGKLFPLATISVAGVYQLFLDLNVMANGDEIVLIQELQVLTGGTLREFLPNVFANAQADPIKMSIPITVLWSLKIFLAQVKGTARSVPWEIAVL